MTIIAIIGAHSVLILLILLQSSALWDMAMVYRGICGVCLYGKPQCYIPDLDISLTV